MVRLRWRPVVTASSNAAAIPLRPRPRIVSIISCRCIIASQQIIASAVGNRRMAQHPVFRGDDAMGRRRLAVPREDVEDQLVAGRFGRKRFARGSFDQLKTLCDIGSESCRDSVWKYEWI